MRKVIIALAIAGVLLIPSSALATTEVSSADQAWLEAHGWSAGDDDPYMGDTATFVPFGATGDCAHHHARRAAAALRYASGNPMIRGGTKLAICVNTAKHKISAREAVFRHASPGRCWKQDTMPETYTRWIGTGGNDLKATGIYHFKYGCTEYAEFNLWEIIVTVEAHVWKNNTVNWNVHRIAKRPGG
jgi:hypothetical protein